MYRNKSIPLELLLMPCLMPALELGLVEIA